MQVGEVSREVVERAQAGDGVAVAALYETLAPQIERYMLYRTHWSQEVAEDLTADVFLKVLENLALYEDRGLPFEAWVYRIAANRLTDHIRLCQKRGVATIGDGSHVEEPRAERALEQLLVRNVLERAIGHLTAEQRQVIVLRFLQDATLAETAAALGKSDDAVKKLQVRGLRALRRFLRSSGSIYLAA